MIKISHLLIGLVLATAVITILASDPTNTPPFEERIPGYIPAYEQASVEFVKNNRGNLEIQKSVSVVLTGGLQKRDTVRAFFSRKYLPGLYLTEYKHVHPDFNSQKVPVVLDPTNNGEYDIVEISRP